MFIDIFCLIVFIGGFFFGYSRGIIKTILYILSIMFGVVVAIKFGPHMTNFLEGIFNEDSPLMFLAGLLVTFLLTMFVIRMLAKGLEGILEAANINFINQLMGGAILAVISIGLFSVLITFSVRARLIDDKTIATSQTYPYLEVIPQKLKVVTTKLKPIFKDFWNHSMDFMDRIDEMNIEESDKIYDIEEDKKKE